MSKKIIYINVIIIISFMVIISGYATIETFFNLKNNIQEKCEITIVQANEALNQYFTNLNEINKTLFYNDIYQDNAYDYFKNDTYESYLSCIERMNEILFYNKNLLGAHFISLNKDILVMQEYDNDFFFYKNKEEIINKIDYEFPIDTLYTTVCVTENKQSTIYSVFKLINYLEREQEELGIGVFYLNRRGLENILSVNSLFSNVLFEIIDVDNNIILGNNNDRIGLKYEPYSSKSQSYSIVEKYSNWNIKAEILLVPILKESFKGVYVIIFLSISLIVVASILSFIFNKKMTQAISFLSNEFNECNPNQEYDSHNIYDIARAFKTLFLSERTKERKIREIELEKKEYEIRALAFQINSHFIFNTLSTIRVLVKIDSNRAIDAMDLLVNFLRYSVRSSLEIAVYEEIFYLNSYIDILKLRFEDRYDISIECYDCENYYIAKMILQPLLENVITHAFNGVEKGKCKISFTHKEHSLEVSIKDDGIGFDENEIKNIELNLSNNDYASFTNKKDKSIGMKNVNRRIKLFYGEKFGLKVKSQGINKGTEVILTLPIIKEEK